MWCRVQGLSCSLQAKLPTLLHFCCGGLTDMILCTNALLDMQNVSAAHGTLEQSICRQAKVQAWCMQVP